MPCEAYRSIFKCRDVLIALCLSKKCKIPKQWRDEIRWSLKHFPNSFDVEVKGYKLSSNKDYFTEYVRIVEYAKMIDDSVKPKKKAKKRVKK